MSPIRMEFTFTAPLWLYSGEAAWHFVTLPVDIADEVEETAPGPKRGFGSLRVAVTIGTTSWETSIFPDSKAGSYVLPVKRQVREREGLVDGDDVMVVIALLEV